MDGGPRALEPRPPQVRRLALDDREAGGVEEGDDVAGEVAPAGEPLLNRLPPLSGYR